MNDVLDPRSEKHAELKIGSERSFGLVFAVVFAFIAQWPFVGGGKVHLLPLAIAVLFLAAGFGAAYAYAYACAAESALVPGRNTAW